MKGAEKDENKSRYLLVSDELMNLKNNYSGDGWMQSLGS